MQVLNIVYQVCGFFFLPNRKQRWLPWPLISWDIFDFTFATLEQNCPKLYKMQVLNVIWGAALAEWFSSWLAKQEVRGSIPRLATWISEIGYLLLQTRDMAEIGLKPRKSSIQPTNQLNVIYQVC